MVSYQQKEEKKGLTLIYKCIESKEKKKNRKYIFLGQIVPFNSYIIGPFCEMVIKKFRSKIHMDLQ